MQTIFSELVSQLSELVSRFVGYGQILILCFLAILVLKQVLK